ncbi:MAG TPA: hypothetical protein PKX23_00985 [Verrucomicrobiota bacterium]|nr:hypothetical protein [Verrucomicrobiota bacterium]
MPPAGLNTGQFFRCPGCRSEVQAEAFPALDRPLPRGAAGEAVMVPGESACFYHEARKAVAVCDACGRFLCALCDCHLNTSHFCPGCLNAGRQDRRIQELETVRPLYGRQAFVLSLLPLFITGLLALFLALRYWKAPLSLVKPQRWMLPAAVFFGALQTLAFTLLFYRLFAG